MAFREETPLENVLKYIRSESVMSDGTELPIYIDPKALDRQDINLLTPVVIDLEGVPLRTSLRLILKQIDLAYCVKDGILIISSVDGVFQELEEAEEERQAEATGNPSGTPRASSEPKPEPEPGPARDTGNPSRAGGQGPKEPAEQPGPGPGPKSEKAEVNTLSEVLDEPINLTIDRPTPLGTVLGQIQEETRKTKGVEVQVYVDPMVKASLTMPVEWDRNLKDFSLKTNLNYLFKKLELGWIVLDGVLIIAKPVGKLDKRIEYYFGTLKNSGMDLARPITLSYPNPTPLKTVMESIRDAIRRQGGEFDFHLGPRNQFTVVNGPKDTAFETEDQRIVIDLKDVPARLALALVLSQTGYVDAGVIDGKLVIAGWSFFQDLGHRPFQAGIGIGGGIGGGMR